MTAPPSLETLAEPILPTLFVLDYFGVLVFAMTGALAAAREKHDLVTLSFFAAVTGVGGGTLRDLLIGAPVFWVQDWKYVAVCLVGALTVWFVGRPEWRFRALLWLDALGLAAYGVIGAAKASATRSGGIWVVLAASRLRRCPSRGPVCFIQRLGEGRVRHQHFLRPPRVW